MVWGLCPILGIVADGAVPNHPSAARRCDGSRRARGRRPVGRLVGMVRGSGLHGGHRAPDPHAGRREATDGADDEERQDGQDEHRQPDERRARRQDASRPTGIRCGGREHRRRRAESRRDGTRGRWCDRRVDAGPRRTPQGSRRAASRSGVGAAAGGGETLRCVRRRAHDEGESTRAPRDALEGASLRRNDIMYIIGALRDEVYPYRSPRVDAIHIPATQHTASRAPWGCRCQATLPSRRRNPWRSISSAISLDRDLAQR